jgi:hypothetical protein
MLIELDARDLMKNKGYKLTAINQTKISVAQNVSKEEILKFSGDELLEHNDDVRRTEDKAEQEKRDKYDGVSDDTKNEAAANALGLDLVQIS